jgi:hypothetical protein
MRSHVRWIVVPALCLGLVPGCGDTASAGEFNAALCGMVAGTLNIQWEGVAGPSAPCAGIETTDGVVADAQDGMATFDGVSVSNADCIGVAAYEFTVSQDGLSLNGTDTRSSVPLAFTRAANEACFVGHWALGGEDYRGHIAAEPFGVEVGP